MNTENDDLKVYVAAPYELAPFVRNVHGWLRAHDVMPVSHWAEMADGPEDLASLSIEEVQWIAAKNDADLLSAHVVLVLAHAGMGAEMFAEARMAVEARIPVLWVGSRRPLTAYRPGVHRVHCIGEALAAVVGFDVITYTPWPRDLEWSREVILGCIEGSVKEAA